MELKQAEQHILSDVFPAAAKFPGLDDHNWKKQVFKAGDTLFKPGQPCNRFVLLGQGAIRVQLQNDQGRSLLLYRIEPGQLCIHSLINLINDENFSYITSAETDGWLCWTEKEQFQQWMDSSSEFQHWIFNNIGSRFKQVIERFANHAFVPVENRLAGLLIEKMGNDQVVKIKQSELAIELGTAREIVSRHLSRWQKQGLLVTNRGEIIISDIDAMLAMAL
ncbi:Crp/Fnr family transcriptional regulator [Solemya velum gill symbiont]|uniref:Crp/Fnr family transcriptional regulator n=1 Tax=Solemya velum gill symbiont TaxID=2340 RepID=UPI000995E183|nr:Crp/Fnr family transcriptional regulator [Solemya velum gill symbiont]OOZ00536.1 hypothetical protein BOW19_00975 [Solemya velum gill symbiont]OOZ02659.1 hypothetical protein BOW20_00965 [Solemya velum gill symbiont]OOZ04880.1 hypothetical protein BOW21_00140 [Solemya velum gill symbiont]OOZ07121.1 hypothetical protein BOW22_00140 [Solemya velum gill symbiont]OOZ09304.1 hypothetical protein BOW23_00140 [Solemya velum gill symbiont]